MFAILTGVTRSLEEKGYSVLLKHMDKGGATAYVRELMQERLADGVILHAALLSRDLAAFLSHADAPYLVIGRPNFPCNICWMDVNHELAGGVAANYLLDRGYRRILYLGGGPEDAISQMRLKGMEAVLREEELTVDTLFWRHALHRGCGGAAAQAVRRKPAGGGAVRQQPHRPGVPAMRHAAGAAHSSGPGADDL